MLLAVSFAAEAQTAFWPTGNDRCPCIDPFSASIDLGTHAPAVASSSCAIARSDGFCFPATHGALTCEHFDLDVAPECGQVQKPSWCSDMWCYVDPTNCERPHSPSGYFSNATIVGVKGRAVPLSYSYETWSLAKDSNPRHIRGSWPHPSIAEGRAFESRLSSQRLCQQLHGHTDRPRQGPRGHAREWQAAHLLPQRRQLPPQDGPAGHGRRWHRMVGQVRRPPTPPLPPTPPTCS